MHIMQAATAATQSISYANPNKPPTKTNFFAQYKNFNVSHKFGHNLVFKRSNLQVIRIISYPNVIREVGVVHAASTDGIGNAPVSVSQGWFLEPVGDGDWKHIGQKVERPGSYEILSNEMIVGRVPDRADLVIPVATVSGLHARIQNKNGSLLVTDLDSTNGTYINEKRVPPGATVPVPPGSLLTFGDTHLAIFRVSKLEKAQETEEAEEPQVQTEETQEKTEVPQEKSE